MLRFLPLLAGLCLLPASAAVVTQWSAVRAQGPNDYYTRAAIQLPLDKTVTAPAWLEIAYLDRGLIAVPGARSVWGVARLNSGRVRHAIFRLDKLPTSIVIHGLPALQSAALSDSEPARTSRSRW